METNLAIGILDSGAGGLTTLTELINQNCAKKYIYFGDTENLPYGNKTRKELFTITTKNIDYLISNGATAIVLACNTLSSMLYSDLIKIYPQKIFGVFPPVNLASKFYKNPLLLATVGTVNALSPLSINAVALPNLAKDIEENLFSLDNIALSLHLSKQTTDAVILGCTHYLHIRKEIETFFNAPTLSGNFITAKTVKSTLTETLPESTHHSSITPEIIFLGSSGQNYSQFFKKIAKNGL